MHRSPFSLSTRSFSLPISRQHLVLLAFAFVIGAWCLVNPLNSGTKAQSTPPTCATCSAPAEQVIYTPLVDLQGSSLAEINLNCRSSHPIEVVPTFYKKDGTAITGETITLNPADMRFIDVQSLIPTANRGSQDWGGMSLSYTGRRLEVWGQMTFHGIGNGQSANSYFTNLSSPSSDVRSAVWKSPKNSTATIALGNSSDTPASSTLTFSNGDVESVMIAPHGTRIVSRRNNGQQSTSINAESVTINSVGEPGKVIPVGFVSSNNGNFNSSIRFVDTENVGQANLYSTNFRLKDTRPTIVLSNTTSDPITAQPRFLPLSGEGNGVVELPAVTIPGYGVERLDLTSLESAAASRNDLDSVTVEIINSGAKGSLVGAANFTNNVTGVTYDIPLRDSGLTRNSAGGYPVRLDHDYTTTLSISNVSDTPGKFSLQINFDGGPYAMYPQELAPGATAVFDLRKMRDEQIPDSSGRVLPRNLTIAQIRWSIVGGDQARLMGRSEIVSRSGKVSSSYSCGVCGNSYYSSHIVVEATPVDVGDTAQLTAWEQDSDIYGNLYSEYSIGATWSGYDTSVVSMSLVGVATGVAPGSTNVTASWMATTFTSNGDPGEGDCDSFRVPEMEYSSLEVRPTVKILRNNQVIGSSSNPSPPVQTVSVGESIDLSTSVSVGSGDKTYQWTIPGTVISSWVPTYSGPTSPTSATTGSVSQADLSQAFLSYYWVDGGDAREVQFTVTVAGTNYTAKAKFNVKRPTSTLTATPKSRVQLGTIKDTDGTTDVFALSFGKPNNSPVVIGMQFDASVTLPAGITGHTEWVQVISASDRSKTPNSGHNQIIHASGLFLDTSYPYDPTLDVTPENDNPREELDVPCNYTRVSANDTLTMYLMFKPTISNGSSIYVPLKKVQWSWGGVGTRSGDCNSWSLSNDSPVDGTVINGVTADAPPTWTANIKSFAFHDE